MGTLSELKDFNGILAVKCLERKGELSSEPYIIHTLQITAHFILEEIFGTIHKVSSVLVNMGLANLWGSTKDASISR